MSTTYLDLTGVTDPTEEQILQDYTDAWRAIEARLQAIIAKVKRAEQTGLGWSDAWASQAAQMNQLLYDIQTRIDRVAGKYPDRLEARRRGLVSQGMRDAAEQIAKVQKVDLVTLSSEARDALRPEIKALGQELSQRYGIELDVRLLSDVVSIEWIIVPEGLRGSGIGSQAIQDLLARTDKLGLPVTARPSPPVAADFARVVRFNERLGFKMDPGRPGYMTRQPQSVGVLEAVRFPSVPFERLAYRRNLDQLFQNLGDKAAKDARRVLLNGMAQGKGPLTVAGQLAKVLDGNRFRAQTIARTEMLQVYRDTALETYRENRDVVEAWMWKCEPDACDICLEHEDELFQLDQDFDTHPNCRCYTEPVTVSATEVLD